MLFNQCRLMRKTVHVWGASFLCLCLSGTIFAQAPLPPPPTPEPGTQAGATELTRGPVHEAFAQPYQMITGGDFVVAQTPPEPIDEVPPREVPQDPAFQWVSGYWGWEPEEERFIWISGLWRRAPEEMVWNPGYWVEVESGYTWVSGSWVEEGEAFLITQTPPEPREENPDEPPTQQHFWVPGQWNFDRGGFSWQPGFWSRGYEGRVWIPLRYLWTPQGYLVVNGYWDYDLEDRGVLYSPVAFDQIPQPTYRYVPSVVTRVEYLPTHLFVYRPYGHYCFGDYYGYSRPGLFFSWTSRSYRYYDPLRFFFLAFHRNRFDHHRHRHDWYFNHRDYRPRHTWRDQRDFLHRHINDDDFDDDLRLTHDAKKFLKDHDDDRSRIRFSENRERWNEVIAKNNREKNLKKEYDQQLKKIRNSKTPSSSFPKEKLSRIGPLQIRSKDDKESGRSGKSIRSGSSGSPVVITPGKSEKDPDKGKSDSRTKQPSFTVRPEKKSSEKTLPGFQTKPEMKKSGSSKSPSVRLSPAPSSGKSGKSESSGKTKSSSKSVPKAKSTSSKNSSPRSSFIQKPSSSSKESSSSRNSSSSSGFDRKPSSSSKGSSSSGKS